MKRSWILCFGLFLSLAFPLTAEGRVGGACGGASFRVSASERYYWEAVPRQDTGSMFDWITNQFTDPGQFIRKGYWKDLGLDVAPSTDEERQNMETRLAATLSAECGALLGAARVKHLEWKVTWQVQQGSNCHEPNYIETEEDTYSECEVGGLAANRDLMEAFCTRRPRLACKIEMGTLGYEVGLRMDQKHSCCSRPPLDDTSFDPSPTIETEPVTSTPLQLEIEVPELSPPTNPFPTPQLMPIETQLPEEPEPTPTTIVEAIEEIVTTSMDVDRQVMAEYCRTQGTAENAEYQANRAASHELYGAWQRYYDDTSSAGFDEVQRRKEALYQTQNALIGYNTICALFAADLYGAGELDPASEGWRCGLIFARPLGTIDFWKGEYRRTSCSSYLDLTERILATTIGQETRDKVANCGTVAGNWSAACRVLREVSNSPHVTSCFGYMSYENQASIQAELQRCSSPEGTSAELR